MIFVSKIWDGSGYLAYQDKNTYCASEVYYSRVRDTPRGVDRFRNAVSNKDYAVTAYLDADGLYRFELRFKSGLILRSSKQYNSIKKAEKAGWAWTPLDLKLKSVEV
jgi:hypothetical protein